MHFLGAKKRTVAVADVGSGSVAFALLEVRNGAPARVLAAERAVLPVEEREEEATATLLGQRLAEIGSSAFKRSHTRAVDSLYVIIRAPWVNSRTVRAQKKLSADTVVKDQMVAELAKQALAADTEVDRKNILEAGVVRVELNGYPTGKPEGKRAHEISVAALATSLTHPTLRTAVENGLRRILPHSRPVFRSSTRMLVTVLGERDLQRDYFIVDIGSEATAFIPLWDGIATETRLVPEGARSILKRIAPTASAEETFSLLRMLARDECSAEQCAALEAAMGHSEPELVRRFAEGMAACAALRRLPNKLLLIAHPDLVPWLSRFFSRIDFAQFTCTTQPFQVETLSLEDLSRWVTPPKEQGFDSGIALSSTLVNIEAQRD